MKAAPAHVAAISICAALAFSGCASAPAPAAASASTGTAAAAKSSPDTSPSPSPSPAAKPSLEFVDLQAFDSDLRTSLSAPLPKVDVAFFGRITPSALPERLQHWMTAVQAGGGSVKVVPPASTVTTRNPMMLINLLSSFWTASEAIKSRSTQAQYRVAHAFDAQIVLKLDDKGDTVVDRVVFLKK